MTLQQSTALRPFMGQSSTFLMVTRWAGKHNIRGVIRTASTQRNNMLDMVSSQLSRAIIAFAFLPLMLSLDVLVSDYAASLILISAISSSVCTQFEQVVSSPIATLFSMGSTIETRISQYFRSVHFTILLLICHSLLIVCLAICLPLSAYLFGVFLTVSFSVLNMLLPMLLSIIACSCSSTIKALGTKARFTIRASMKILGSSRKQSITGASTSLAWGIILGYHVHDKGQLLVRPRSVHSTRGASSCFPHYSTNPPIEQVQGVCYGA
jgi:hypothetical protein